MASANSGSDKQFVVDIINDRFLEGKTRLFRGWRNLAQELMGLTEYGGTQLWPPDWVSGLAQYWRSVAHERTLANTIYDRNPLGGQFKHFPIVACLTAEPMAHVYAQYRSLCLLVLLRIVHGNSNFTASSHSVPSYE